MDQFQQVVTVRHGENGTGQTSGANRRPAPATKYRLVGRRISRTKMVNAIAASAPCPTRAHHGTSAEAAVKLNVEFGESWASRLVSDPTTAELPSPQRL